MIDQDRLNACLSAERVLHLFEQHSQADGRARQVIAAARQHALGEITFLALRARARLLYATPIVPPLPPFASCASYAAYATSDALGWVAAEHAAVKAREAERLFRGDDK